MPSASIIELFPTPGTPLNAIRLVGDCLLPDSSTIRVRANSISDGAELSTTEIISASVRRCPERSFRTTDGIEGASDIGYSTVTLFAKFRGISTLQPRATAT